MTVELHLGDCRTVMAAMPEASIDSIVTDPPYGLSSGPTKFLGDEGARAGFMGKAWDHGVPGPDFWREALRVAKPGAHLVAFGGTRTFHRLTCAIEDAGWEVRDVLAWMYGSGFPKSHNGAWGGTALKPAYEPIILARKPLAGTVAATFAAHGTGGLNVDGCRIAADWSTDPTRRGWQGLKAPNGGMFVGGVSANLSQPNAAGRWPANVILDEDAGALLDAQSGVLTSGKSDGFVGEVTTSVALGAKRNQIRPESVYGDSGGASRFFYCAKASRRERGEGNDWPTVKPLALMRWLCRLVTPAGGVVLDPFHGSGSTLLAARDEGFRAIGIDMDEHAREIAMRRLGMQEAA